MNGSSTFVTHARSDGADRLVEADEPLASLQQRCGGHLGGLIAVPELLALVRKSRGYGLRLARNFRAFDGEDTILAWAEIEPSGEAGGGCSIRVSNWRAVPGLPDADRAEGTRALSIARAAAELSATLDPAQKILSVECRAPDLASAAEAMRSATGHHWTEFVDLPEIGEARSLHWRLLDGAECTVSGSDRRWRVVLEPIGHTDPGSTGFELYLIGQSVLPHPLPQSVEREEGAMHIGRHLTPALRQPIARIIANAETIRTRLAGPLADEYSDYAADIAAAGQHLLTLLDDLTDMEVVESQDFSTAPDLIDLGDVARRAAGILAVRAQERRVAVITPQHGEVLEATGEFRRVLQILLNLLGNAIAYSPEGSQVWMRLEEAGGRSRITVADQGPGLSEAQQAAVFNKFERLGRSGDGGSGLGLYISRKLALAMGGDLVVESAPGQGARFTLDMPGPDGAA